MQTALQRLERPSETQTPVLSLLEAPRQSAPALDAILQTGLGFWASKTLLSAIELGVFTELARGPLDAETLRQRLGLHARSARDFFDALVALKFLKRRQGRYSNTPETDFYLDRNKATYAGGLLEMCNARLYGFWGALTEALRSGELQNEAKSGGDYWEAIYRTPETLEAFLSGMTGLSLGAAMALAEKFPWADYRTLADIGAAQGAVPVQLALRHPHLQAIGYDMPRVEPVFQKYVRANGVPGRVRFQAGDFFKDPLPQADVLIMGHILHDWDLEEKRRLLAKAHAALPPGGALIVYDAMIDNDRRENAFGLLMSLNMLIETPGGFDYTVRDCEAWMRDAGFTQTRAERLVGPDSMVIGFKRDGAPSR